MENPQIADPQINGDVKVQDKSFNNRFYRHQNYLTGALVVKWLVESRNESMKNWVKIVWM